MFVTDAEQPVWNLICTDTNTRHSDKMNHLLYIGDFFSEVKPTFVQKAAMER